MRRVCSWCGKYLGEKEQQGEQEFKITHGLCADCYHHLLAMEGMNLQPYLDGLKEPIVVVDSNVVVKGANKAACAFLHQDLPALEGYLCGQVFECERSYLPEGCGQTVHCSGCTIRRAVAETFATGRSLYRLPVTLLRRTAAVPQNVHLLISTQRVGKVVFVRVDEAESK